MRHRPKLPMELRYEVSPQGNPSGAIESVLRIVRAAHDLELPFSVETEHSKQFRYGGNVVKADVVTYVVTVGKVTEKER